MPPAVGQVQQVPRGQRAIVAERLFEAREGLQVRRHRVPHHRLAVARMRDWEGVQPQVIHEWEQHDLLRPADLEEHVLPLVEMQRGLNALHPDEELAEVGEAHAARLAQVSEGLPAPRAHLLGHAPLGGQGVLQVHALGSVSPHHARGLRDEDAGVLFPLLTRLIELILPPVQFQVVVPETVRRRPLDIVGVVRQQRREIAKVCPPAHVHNVSALYNQWLTNLGLRLHDATELFEGRVPHSPDGLVTGGPAVRRERHVPRLRGPQLPQGHAERPARHGQNDGQRGRQRCQRQRRDRH
mmetsp:Transcript_102645/g.313934  ORF Transcript_102645/g.313934 Transcript_102645/m.313934 type:complete len:297 (-) Transcript_102645:83-973(-)